MFDTISDARKGTTAVNRIYRGDTLVWSRYNWEKWSCRTNYSYGLGTERTHTGWLNQYESADSYINCSTRTNKSDNYYEFSGEKTGTGLYVKDLYDKGYTYCVSAGTRVYPGDSYAEFTGYGTNDAGYRVLNLGYYKVIQTTEPSGYSQGGTNYGIVTGNQGDYPANGRHSDGYWYVAAGAMGFSEEGEI